MKLSPTFLSLFHQRRMSLNKVSSCFPPERIGHRVLWGKGCTPAEVIRVHLWPGRLAGLVDMFMSRGANVFEDSNTTSCTCGRQNLEWRPAHCWSNLFLEKYNFENDWIWGSILRRGRDCPLCSCRTVGTMIQAWSHQCAQCQCFCTSPGVIPTKLFWWISYFR